MLDHAKIIDLNAYLTKRCLKLPAVSYVEEQALLENFLSRMATAPLGFAPEQAELLANLQSLHHD